ncbi:hypothetical protein ACXO6E_09475, partial [Lactobacillus delbrueckii subsp. bulgaricus]
KYNGNYRKQYAKFEINLTPSANSFLMPINSIKIIKQMTIRYTANFPGFYNSSHTADRFSASRISFMH